MIRDYMEYRRLAALHAQSSDRIKIFQVLGLRDLLRRAFDVPFYGERLRRAGNKPGDLRTVKDLAMMPATSDARFAEELVARAEASAEREPRDREAPASRGSVVFDARGRILPCDLGASERARRLHLFAALRARGVGPRSRIAVECEDDLGVGAGDGGFLFRVARAASGAMAGTGDGGLGGGAPPHRRARARVIEPGQLGALPRAALSSRREADGGSSRDHARDLASRVSRGTPVPAPVLDALGLAPEHAPRAIVGDALFGPIAWECAARSLHPIAARAVFEAVTEEGVARGLTGGSRASRAPRSAGELHLTLIESAQLPVFRIALGLRGRLGPNDCACGARTERIEMELPFLGPLRIGEGEWLDPLPILRAASATPGARRVALLQEGDAAFRLLVAIAEKDGGGGTVADERAIADAAAPRARGITLQVSAGSEASLPFPERGFVAGLSQAPLVRCGVAGGEW